MIPHAGVQVDAKSVMILTPCPYDPISVFNTAMFDCLDSYATNTLPL